MNPQPGAKRFRYDWSVFKRDLIAGATVAAIAIPQAMAYALIAGVDPRYGLYSAIIVTIVASVLGSSNHLINGPTNAISIVVFGALGAFQGHFGTAQAMFLLAIMVGIIQILISVFKLGDLTRYVSESVILGFMAGAGVLVAVGQVGNFLGAAKKGTADQSVLLQLWETLNHGGPFNLYAVGLGTGTILVVLLLRRIIQKYDLPQMDMLIGLLAAAGVAAAFGWSIPGENGKSVVNVVGKIPAALPIFYIPEIQWEWISKLLGSAFAISFLGLIEALAVAKSIAVHTRQPLDYNRQCLAEGVSNLVGGFFQSIPGSGSLTRSSINHHSGAVTRWSGVYAGIIVAIVVMLFGPYAKYIPKPALAGLLFVTAARLIDWKRLKYALRASRFDAILVIVTAFSAVFISVDESILIGVAISILMFVPRAARLGTRELIAGPDDILRERQAGESSSESVLIFDIEGELFFGAAPELERNFERILNQARREGVRHVVVRLRRTRNPDVVAVEHLEHFVRAAVAEGITVYLTGVLSDLQKMLENVGFESWLPGEQFFPVETKKYTATMEAVREAYRRHREELSNAAGTQDQVVVPDGRVVAG